MPGGLGASNASGTSNSTRKGPWFRSNVPQYHIPCWKSSLNCVAPSDLHGDEATNPGLTAFVSPVTVLFEWSPIRLNDAGSPVSLHHLCIHRLCLYPRRHYSFAADMLSLSGARLVTCVCKSWKNCFILSQIQERKNERHLYFGARYIGICSRWYGSVSTKQGACISLHRKQILVKYNQTPHLWSERTTYLVQ